MKHFRLLWALLALLACLPASGQIRASRGAYPTNYVNDVVLMYYGASWRMKWTPEQLQPLVTHRFTDGHTDWMFPGFLFLEFTNNEKRFFNYHTDKDTELNSAKREDWLWLQDRLFAKGKDLDGLDKCIDNAIKQLGTPPFRHKVIVNVPTPIIGHKSWGTLNGKKMNFSKTADRIAAAKWYIDTFIERFNQQGFKNIDLDGFYWCDEWIGENDDELVKTVANYIHSKNMHFYWIPFFNSRRASQWQEFGFDIAYLQPGHFFHPNVADSRLDEACQRARNWGMGLEMEFDKRYFTKRNQYQKRFPAYIDAFERNGVWENSAIAYYVENNAVNLFAADTTRVSDKRVMDRMAQHIVDRNRKYHATPAATQPSTQPTTPNKPLDWRDPEYWHF